MSYRRHVVAATILRIFLVAGLFAVLAFSLLRVDSATYAQTESAPTLTATPAAGAVELSWTEVSGAVRYDLWTWWDAAIGWQQIGGDSLTDTTYTHTEVTAGVTYYYAVRGMDAAGEAVSAWSDYATATPLSGIAATATATPTPTAASGSSLPSSLTATPAAGAVELSWTEVSGAVRYDLRTWWDAAIGWQQIGGDSLTGTTYTHTEVTAGVTYYYAVRGMDAAGEAVSAWSDYATATPLSGIAATATATPTPTAASGSSLPSSLTATPAAGAVELSWTEVSGAVRYDLWTWWDAAIGWQQIGGDSLTDTTYTHTEVTAGVIYYYAVRGLDAAGEAVSAWSDYASAAPLPGTAATATPTPTATAAPANTDREVLVALYNATDGANWTNSTNWLSDKPPGEWHGVTTNSNGRVIELDLYGNQLSGSIPSELGNLANLTTLGLAVNQLSGSIPSELGNLANLTGLWLSANQLSGEIPSELRNLANLTILGLSSNQLSGAIPSELGNLANLTTLALSANQLSGAIPSELGNLTNLTGLGLAGNQLSGTIPSELGNLSNLTGLGLSYNQLSGSIPSELGNLANLTKLYLSANQLTGSIPSELGNLANLTLLWLADNQLTGCVPATLQNVQDNDLNQLGLPFCSAQALTDRDVLVALYNTTNGASWTYKTNWLSDRPLGEWHGVTTDAYGRVTELNITHNQLSGPIPPELGNLSNLTRLLLYGNELSGSIPSELGNLSNLIGMTLGLNQLSGSIPSELGNLSNLTSLQLSSNQLSGPIPSELGNLSNLTSTVARYKRVERTRSHPSWATSPT